MIQLSESFRIRLDIPNNVTLEQLVSVEDSKTKAIKKCWELAGYYSSIKSAVKQSFELEIQKSSSLEDLFKRLDKSEKRMEEIFLMRFSPLYNISCAVRDKT